MHRARRLAPVEGDEGEETDAAAGAAAAVFVLRLRTHTTHRDSQHPPRWSVHQLCLDWVDRDLVNHLTCTVGRLGLQAPPPPAAPAPAAARYRRPARVDATPLTVVLTCDSFLPSLPFFPFLSCAIFFVCLCAHLRVLPFHVHVLSLPVRASGVSSGLPFFGPGRRQRQPAGVTPGLPLPTPSAVASSGHMYTAMHTHRFV